MSTLRQRGIRPDSPFPRRAQTGPVTLNRHGGYQYVLLAHASLAATQKARAKVAALRVPVLPETAYHAVGTEIRTPHGTRWVKVALNTWRARSEWGVLDEWTDYDDRDVYGEVIATGVTS